MSLDAETAQALNALLEDTRANVEIFVELVNGATETSERETCTALGQDAVLLSGALRERLTLAGKTVTLRVNGIVLHILDTEHYDDRLRAFARHQAGICERAEALSAATKDSETLAVLHDLYEAAVRGALWCEQRAATFAASRLLVFGAPRTPTAPAPPAEPSDTHGTSAADAAHPQDANQQDSRTGDGIARPEASEPRDETPDQQPGEERLDGASGGER